MAQRRCESRKRGCRWKGRDHLCPSASVIRSNALKVCSLARSGGRANGKLAAVVADAISMALLVEQRALFGERVPFVQLPSAHGFGANGPTRFTCEKVKKPACRDVLTDVLM